MEYDGFHLNTRLPPHPLLSLPLATPLTPPSHFASVRAQQSGGDMSLAPSTPGAPPPSTGPPPTTPLLTTALTTAQPTAQYMETQPG
jgi:hypothetical protein